MASRLDPATIPKITQKLAKGRVQSAENRLKQRGLYFSILAPFASIDFRQLSIPPNGQFLSLFGYNTQKLLTIAYARVSSHDQKDDLQRQSHMLEMY